MRRALIILIVVVAFAAVTVAIAPASLAGVALERASGGTVALADADGTLWRGRGTITAARALRVPVVWSIEPWALVRGELRLRVSPPNAAAVSPRAEIVARRDAVAMREVDVTIPADVVRVLAPRSGIRIAGDVHVSATSLDWTPATYAGGVRIDWQDAQFAIGNDAGIGLGTVSANLAAASDRLTGPVTNDGGAFELHGTLSLATSGAPNASVTMTPRAGVSAQARTVSVASGPDGNWNIDFRMGPP